MVVESLAKLPKSSRIALSVVVIAIPVIACYNWVIVPHTRYLSAAQQYGYIVGDVAKKHQIIKSRTALKKKKLDELQQSFEQLQEKFFSESEAQRFFREVEIAADQTGCTILSSEYVLGMKSEKKASKQADAITTKSVIISFVASYDSIIEFLAAILDRPQKVSINSLEMMLTGYNPKALQCEATFTIYIINDKEIFTNGQVNIP